MLVDIGALQRVEHAAEAQGEHEARVLGRGRHWPVLHDPVARQIILLGPLVFEAQRDLQGRHGACMEERPLLHFLDGLVG